MPTVDKLHEDIVEDYLNLISSLEQALLITWAYHSPTQKEVIANNAPKVKHLITSIKGKQQQAQ